MKSFKFKLIGNTEERFVDASVTSQIGANIVHLLFVKYEKDYKLSR